MASGTTPAVSDWQTVQSPELKDWQTITPRASPEPTWSDKAKSYLSDALSKTAKSMNVMNTLDKIEDIGDRLKSGDWSAAGDLAKMVPHFEYTPNDESGIIHQGSALVKDVYDKLKKKDYSGATAAVAPYVLAAGSGLEEAGAINPIESATDAARAARQSASNAVKRSPIVAAAKTVVPSAVDVAGEALEPVIKPLTTAGKAVAKATDAYKTQAAINARDAAAAAQRANPRAPIYAQPEVAADTTPTPAPAPAPEPPPMDMAALQQQFRDRVAARKQAPPAPPQPNAVRQAMADARATPAAPAPEPAPVAPVDVEAAKQAMQERIAARKAAEPASGIPQPPATTAPSQELLDGIAQGQLGVKNFASIKNPAMRQSVIDLANRIGANARAKAAASPVSASPVPAAPAAPAQSAPVAAPTTMQHFEKAADVLTTPTAGPISPRIDQAMQHVQDGIEASNSPAATPQPAATPVATPAAESAPYQPPEYYRPSGRGTTDVPSPGTLAKRGLYDPDKVLRGVKESSTLNHVAQENEKAYNIADYLFNERNIRTPEQLGAVQAEIDKGFVEAARKAGAARGNPVPRNAYDTVMGPGVPDLVAAHLGKMIQDEKLGQLPNPKAMADVAPDDMMEILNKSLADLAAKKAAAKQ